MTSISGIDRTAATVVAIGALLVYDVFFVTLEDEIRLFWGTSWGFGKILFFLNRYLPFFDTFLSFHLLTGNMSGRECVLGFRAVTWLIAVGIVLSEMILMIRTMALWGNNRYMRIFLICFAFAIFVPALAITQVEVMSYAYRGTDHGCLKTKASSPIIFISFILLIIFETTIVVLTLIRARQHQRNQQLSSLVKTIYKDGLVYYVYLFAFSLINIVIAVAAPPSYGNLMTTPQRVFHSLLTTRVLIHIRSHASVREDQLFTTGGTLVFATMNPQGKEQLTDASYLVCRTNSSGETPTTTSGYGSGTASGSSGGQQYQSFFTNISTSTDERSREKERSIGEELELQVVVPSHDQWLPPTGVDRAVPYDSRGIERSKGKGREVAFSV